MAHAAKPFGILTPLGGGDPVPLTKTEITIGRRPTNDIRLDYENVSGKHCLLRLVQGVWHVRDLGSTNGTTINRQKIDHEHGLMPDDELSVASHRFAIDYEPASMVMESKGVLEQEMAAVEPQRESLLKMAGVVKDPEARGRRVRPADPPADPAPRPPGDDGDLDGAPTKARKAKGDAASGPKRVSDDDFFRMIEDDIKKGE